MNMLLRDVSNESASRGVALRMTFDGGAQAPEITGKEVLSGHHNYFLGDDRKSWRTRVPLYASVLYESLYPGIDLRLRTAHGAPEYDLILQPGADLSSVNLHVEGANGLRIADDGSLVIETELGALNQPVPKTWETESDGRVRDVACRFVLLATDRFGFEVPNWTGGTSLTIDPGLIWSTYLGGSKYGIAFGVAVDADGVVSVAGETSSVDFPTTLGAYDRTHNGRFYPNNVNNSDVFVSQLDPSKANAAQLRYSTFLGGGGNEKAAAIHVAPDGVLTLAGNTGSSDFPTTSGAFDTTFNGSGTYPRDDVFVVRLDPSKTGSAQLVYSTYLGGQQVDQVAGLAVSPGGVVSVAGHTASNNLPTTPGAYGANLAGGFYDGFVSRLDPSKIGSAQLVYSSYLGGNSDDHGFAVHVDATGVVLLMGHTSSPQFPTTSGAYDTSFNGSDVFLTRLDPSKTGSGQLLYSTYLGGSKAELPTGMAVHAGGVVSMTGRTYSPDYPTTSGAYDRSINGNYNAFVCRLDLNRTGSAQLTYSTYLGGATGDSAIGLAVDADGVITLAGETHSPNFPTTPDAYDRTLSPGGTLDCFLSRLDPRRVGTAQLVYSTFFGGTGNDISRALAVDPSGVATIAGYAADGLPTTPGAYDRTFNAPPNYNPFVSRLDMGVSFHADRYELSLSQPGQRQQLTLNAGAKHGGKSFWIFGSATGASPGVTLGGVHIPLVPDLYTDLTITAPGAAPFVAFRGTLSRDGTGAAQFVMPAGAPSVQGLTLYHAYLVYDARGTWLFGSQPVPLRLVR